MRKIVAVIGEPGTGKTTLIRKFMEPYTWELQNPISQVSLMYSKDIDLIILGKYEEGEIFAGTDRLSMSCQPHVLEYVKDTDKNILFEGDRLTNAKFFDELIKLPETEVSIFILFATKDILKERYTERGSNQSETFLKGRSTKISNIGGNFEYMDYIQTFNNKNLVDQEFILHALKTKFFK